MIPVLYASNETNFASNGIGLLKDSTACTVTEQRNGKFVLELIYPASGWLFDQIKDDMIIKAKPNDVSNNQLFRIYHHTSQIDGKVTFDARHISYDLAYNPLPKMSLSGNAAAVLNQILQGGLNPHPFTGFSDSTTESSSEVGPCTVREALGGKEGSLLDNWGGEYEFDNFTVHHHVRRGRDTGVLVEYGKNLTDFSQEQALADVFTSVYAYAKKQDDNDNEQLITLPNQIVHLDSENNYPVIRTLMLDLSDDDSVTDAETLKTATEKYAQDNKIDQPSVSWSLKFQNLRKTQDYKDVAALETCSLCDYIRVRFSRYGVDVKAEIIEASYNTLLEEYNSMDLGDPISNFVTDYQNQQKQNQTQFDRNTNFFLDAIDRATKAITGASGGYVRLIPSRNPQEIVIMDTPDIATATRVWRWNLGGLGYSHNGYNGPYELAMTMDGEIVADFITAGVLRSILIEGTDIHMFNEDKTFDARLNSNGLLMTKNGEPIFSVDADGNVKTYGAEIEGGSIHLINDAKDFEATFDTNGLKLYKNRNPIFTVDSDGNLNVYGAKIEGGSLHQVNGDSETWIDQNGFHVTNGDFEIWINGDGFKALKNDQPLMEILPDGTSTFYGEVNVSGETIYSSGSHTETAVSRTRLHRSGLEYYMGDRLLASLGQLFNWDDLANKMRHGVGFSLQDGDYISINYKDANGNYPRLVEYRPEYVHFFDTYLKNAQTNFVRPVKQKKILTGEFGTPTNPIFTGAEHAPQGLAYVKLPDGSRKLFMRVRVSGDAWAENELSRICMFTYTEDGARHAPEAITQPLAIGHQNISAYVDNDGQIWLFTGLYTGKGYSKIKWRGSSTSSSDIEHFAVWADGPGSGQIYEDHIEGSPCISHDGQYIVLQAKGTWPGSSRRVQVYQRAFIEANQDNLSGVFPFVEFPFDTINVQNSQVLQDIACDGNVILLLAGYFNPFGHKIVYAFDMTGARLAAFHVDGPLGDYSDYEILGWSSKGIPCQIEPEGIDIREDGKILVLMHDAWRPSAPIVSYEGLTYAYIGDEASAGNPPYDELHWVRVDGKGSGTPWSATTTYQPGAQYNKKDKNVYLLSPFLGDGTAINRGIVRQASGGTFHINSGTHDLTFPQGEDLTFSSFNENANGGERAYRQALKYFNQHAWSVYDIRDGANRDYYAYLSKNSLSGKDQLEIRAGATLTDGGGINITTIRDSDTTNNAHVILYSRGGSTQYNARLQETGAWRPGADNTQNLGTGSNRWKTIYAGTGTINTSDRNYKTDIAPIPDAVLDVWAEVNYQQFKFKDSETPRLHTGVIAQDIKEAFERHGLDATVYGLLCYDQWNDQPAELDEDGNIISPEIKAGERWCVRPDECLMLEAALIRRELNKLKEEVNGGK